MHEWLVRVYQVRYTSEGDGCVDDLRASNNRAMFGFLRRRRERRENRQYYRMLKEVFGLRPNNVELYKLALVHRSASLRLPNGAPVNNERLEFLGDAVIESVVSDYLYIEFPYESEGFLTQMRSRLVNRVTLNQLCVDIGLAEYIHSNSGGGRSGDGVMKNINGDAFEAMIGAMYLDKGYEFTNRLLIKLLAGRKSLEEVTSTETDFKSRLIEWCQKNKHHVRFVSNLGQWGDAKRQTFRTVAMIDGIAAGYGLGVSKKEAEQQAAYAVSNTLTLDEERGDALLDLIDGFADKTVHDDVDAPKRKRRRGGRRKKTGGGETVGHENDSVPETVDSKDNTSAVAVIGSLVETITADKPVEDSKTVDTEPTAENKPAPRGRKPKTAEPDHAEKAAVSGDKPVRAVRKPRAVKGAHDADAVQETGKDNKKVATAAGKDVKGTPSEKPARKKSAKPGSAGGAKSIPDGATAGKVAADGKPDAQKTGKNVSAVSMGDVAESKPIVRSAAGGRRPESGDAGENKTAARNTAVGVKSVASGAVDGEKAVAMDIAKDVVPTAENAAGSSKLTADDAVNIEKPAVDAATPAARSSAGVRRRGRPRKTIKPEE